MGALAAFTSERQRPLLLAFHDRRGVSLAAAVDRLGDIVDEMVVRQTTRHSRAIGSFCESLRIVADAEGRELLGCNHAARGGDDEAPL